MKLPALEQALTETPTDSIFLDMKVALEAFSGKIKNASAGVIDSFADEFLRNQVIAAKMLITRNSFVSEFIQDVVETESDVKDTDYV